MTPNALLAIGGLFILTGGGAVVAGEIWGVQSGRRHEIDTVSEWYWWLLAHSPTFGKLVIVALVLLGLGALALAVHLRYIWP